MVTSREQDTKHTIGYGNKWYEYGRGGNAYTCLGTRTQELER